MSARRFHPPLRQTLEDKTAERIRQSHAQAIEELQAVPLVRGKLITGITIPNNGNVWVGHGLGRPARIFVSPPRGGASSTGRITDITDEADVVEDRSKYVVLRGSGWGQDIVVDVWVF